MSDEKPAQEIPTQQPAEPAPSAQQQAPTKPESIISKESVAPQNEQSQEKPTEKKTTTKSTPKKLSPREKPSVQMQEETTPRKPYVYRGPPPRKNMVISPMKEKDWKGNGKSI